MTLWSPSFVGIVGAKPPVNSGKPSLSSPVWGFDTTVPALFLAAGSGSTQPASGGTVQRIADLFSGARVMQQATEGNKPTWVPNVIGAKAALRFTGTQHMLMDGTNPGTLFQSRTFTALVVFRRQAVNNGAYGGLFTAGNSELGLNNGSYDMFNIETGAAGFSNMYRNGGSDYAYCLPVGASAVANQTQKVVVRSAPANGMEIRIRSQAGAFSGTGALPNTADSFTWNVAALATTMGYQTGRIPYSTLAGDMFEFSFWSSRATDSEFTALQNYLDLKWGV